MKSLIVVEGIHDLERIKKLYKDQLVITTNGSQISKETLSMIKEYSKTYKIIIFTDPDSPGERIRHKILEVVPNASEAFLEKKICISKNHKKVGIEHADLSNIKKALDQYIDKDIECGTLTISDLINLGLSGKNNSSFLRDKISNKLNIGKPNSKTFLKRINALNISYSELEKLIGEINE
jgi:ribonuclease M5